MTYPFYKDILKEITYKLQHEAIMPVIANPYAENAWEKIQSMNPFNIQKNIEKSNKKITISALKNIGVIS